ncbi:hypothetical protein RRF57_006105 [Xylaria bambusicola]|uniref:Uncharacterized protein n=1 Tax=Xylaria bambusicola TaxID=326684 RepID=A0AAN7UDR9_9PEZI
MLILSLVNREVLYRQIAVSIKQEQVIEDPAFKLPWYQWWVSEQMRKLPAHVLMSLPGGDSDGASAAALYKLWSEIRTAVLAPEPRSINSITDMLIDRDLVSTKDSYEAVLSVKDLVFAVIGMQTMLYQACFDSSCPGGYRIQDEMSGYHGTTRMSLYQSSESSARSFPDFILGFGVMLPAPNYCAYENDDDRLLFDQTKTINPGDISAHVLNKLCGVKFQWVDSLSCHLELDKHSGTLYLYRYPSFCVSSLQELNSRGTGEGGRKSVLHACAFEKNGPLPWASEEDVDGLLQEILLSYRVIFGQSKRSRAVFRKLRPFASIPTCGQDQSLAELCSRKRPSCSVQLVEREEYDLTVHFPHLRSRIAQLSGYASRKKPRSLRRLWQDRRDSPAWLAYWSAILFGLIGLFLVFVQTVFQILQYIDQTRSRDS